MIRISGVAKGFSGTWVFRNLNLEIPRGGFCLVRGPNGSGKSTLLKLIAGILLPDEGEIAVEAQRIGYVGHENQLYLQRTVAENLKLFSHLFSSPLLPPGDPFRITPYWKRLVKTLSRGMRMRLVLSRTFALGADLYLLDEPENSLDEEGRSILFAWLERFLEEGKTILWVSHQPEELIRSGLKRQPELFTLTGSPSPPKSSLIAAPLHPVL